MYLIQGIFFQFHTSLGTAWVQTGPRAVINTDYQQFAFQGLLGSHSDQIFDHSGHAEVTNLSLTDSELSFDKLYEGRVDAIHYEFRRQPNGVWDGEFRGNTGVGRGFARCVLTEVTEDFFLPSAEELERARKEAQKRKREAGL